MPCFTHTEFHDELQRFDKARTPAILWMPADAVVEASLETLARRKVICIPGVGNRLLGWIGSSPLVEPAMRVAFR